MTVVTVCEFDACPDHDGPCIPWAGFRLSFPVTDSVDGGVDREIHQEQRPANG